jgi:hypothetical protein
LKAQKPPRNRYKTSRFNQLIKSDDGTSRALFLLGIALDEVNLNERSLLRLIFSISFLFAAFLLFTKSPDIDLSIFGIHIADQSTALFFLGPVVSATHYLLVAKVVIRRESKVIYQEMFTSFFPEMNHDLFISYFMPVKKNRVREQFFLI